MADLVRVNGIDYKRRNPWGVLGLSIITIGVYYFVWWYKINNEMKNYGIEVDPTKAVLAMTLGAFIIVPPYVSVYNTADRILKAQVKSGAADRIAPIIGLILMFVFSVAIPVYYQSQLNKVWDAEAARGAEVLAA
jgi:cbb3-type cytochrome oxidase subunit 3